MKKYLSLGKAIGDVFVYIMAVWLIFLQPESTFRMVTLVGLGIGFVATLVFLLNKIFNSNEK